MRKEIRKQVRKEYKFDTSILTKGIGWAPLPLVHLKKQPPKLMNYTKNLMRQLTPPIPESEFEGGIKVKCGTVIALPDYGKTELLKIICKRLIAHYGIDKINVLTGMHIDSLIENFDEKPVQVLIVEDSTALKKAEQEATIKHYVRIRHKLKEARDLRQQERSGVIIVIFSSHSFYMLLKKIRTWFNFVIMKSSDSNEYNRKTIVREFGYYGLEKLDSISHRYEEYHDSTVLCESVISMIGLEKGGYIYFPYDPVEAAIIPWREIKEEERAVEHVSHKKVKKLKPNLNWGNFFEIMYEELLKEYDNIKDVCTFKTKEIMFDCLHLWFNKLFLGQDEEALEESTLIKEGSINPYITRVNKFFKEFDTRQFQKRVSERWVIEGLSKIKPLSSFLSCCEVHRVSNQPSDVCVHHDSEHLLSINVKWFAKNRAGTYFVDASPEYRVPPAALLVIGSSLRSDHPVAHVRFSILKEGEKKKKIRDLAIMGDNGFILESVAKEIEKLIK